METIGNPDIWAKFGLPGLVIFALFALVIVLIKEQKSGRLEFIEALNKMTNIYDELVKETNAALREMALTIERSTGGCGKK